MPIYPVALVGTEIGTGNQVLELVVVQARDRSDAKVQGEFRSKELLPATRFIQRRIAVGVPASEAQLGAELDRLRVSA
jgi:hypothetical protein